MKLLKSAILTLFLTIPALSFADTPVEHEAENLSDNSAAEQKINISSADYISNGRRMQEFYISDLAGDIIEGVFEELGKVIEISLKEILGVESLDELSDNPEWQEKLEKLVALFESKESFEEWLNGAETESWTQPLFQLLNLEMQKNPDLFANKVNLQSLLDSNIITQEVQQEFPRLIMFLIKLEVLHIEQDMGKFKITIKEGVVNKTDDSAKKEQTELQDQ